MFIEVALGVVVLLALFFTPQFRGWFREVGCTEKQLCLGIIIVLLTCHYLDFSRYTFPFVRWGMYTEKYDPNSMQWGKLKARLEDGSVVDINPTIEFPSLNRNFAERFHGIVSAKRTGELTELGEQVYQDLLVSLGKQYNRRNSQNKAVELTAYLEHLSIENNRARVVLEPVNTLSLTSQEVQCHE